MDSSFYTRVGEGKYEVHFETGEKWKYVLVEAACREAIGHGKALMVTENIVRCGECKWYSIYEAKKDGTPDKRYSPSVCLREIYAKRRDPDWYCADGERKVQE